MFDVEISTNQPLILQALKENIEIYLVCLTRKRAVEESNIKWLPGERKLNSGHLKLAGCVCKVR